MSIELRHHIVATAALLAVASSTSAAQPGAYDFTYRMGGERTVLPLQVFDDGKETYFQWRASTQVVPAIIADTPQGPRVATYHRSGAFIVVPGVATSYRLQFGSLTGQVSYAGPARAVTVGSAPTTEQPAAQPAMATPAASPSTAMPKATPVVARNAVSSGYVVDASIAGSAAPPAGVQTAPAETAGAPTPVVRADVPPAAAGPRTQAVRVPFETGRSQMTAAAQREIRRAFAGEGTITSVTIVGRDDSAAQDGLARSRAMAIRAAAIDAGAPASRIRLIEGLMREGDKATTPTSDLRVVRSSLHKAAHDIAGEPSTIAEAIAMVARGMRALARMGAIDQARADSFVDSLRRMVGMGGPAPTKPDVQTLAPTVTGGVAQGSALDQVTGVWTMLPADGTAQRGLRKWAEQAGMTLDWQADIDYPINSLILVRGSAREAVDSVRQSLETASTPLKVQIDNNRIIVSNKKGAAA